MRVPGGEPAGEGVYFTRCAMAVANVYKLAWKQFDNVVRRAPIVLLAVSEFANRQAPSKVTAFFQGLYGDEFVSAAISVSDVPYRAWLLERLQPARTGSIVFVDGLYLFLGGRAASYHDGFNLTASVIEIAAFLATDGRLQYQSDLHAQEILDLFAPAAAEFIRRRPSSAALNKGSQSAEANAREILGVNAQASELEIDRAWRRLRGEYAPDKVQHVSEAFVRLAHHKVHEIDNAYEVLRRSRTAAGGSQ